LERVGELGAAIAVYKQTAAMFSMTDVAPDALFRAGVCLEKRLDFVGASQTYARVHDEYPYSERAADALYNDAVLQSNLHEFASAARLFARYAGAFEMHADASECHLRAALNWEKAGVSVYAIDSFRAFIARFLSSPEQTGRLIRAHLHLGRLLAVGGNVEEARQEYQGCIQAHDSSDRAIEEEQDDFAAQCQFEIAESDLSEYRGIRDGPLAEHPRAMARLRAERSYERVFRYPSREVIIAAYARLGEIAEDPTAGERSYRRGLDLAKRRHVANEWTDRILAGLHAVAPAEFPAHSRALPSLELRPITANGLDAGSSAQ
jgi:TolA-binding protein